MAAVACLLRWRMSVSTVQPLSHTLRVGTQSVPFSSAGKRRHQPNGQQAPTEAFFDHVRRAGSKFSSAIARRVGPLPAERLSSQQGRRQAVAYLVNCVYALDDALRLAVSKVWAGALPASNATASAQGSAASGSFQARVTSYYSSNPYEVVYHSIGVFILAWLAWEHGMDLSLPQQQTMMQSTVLSAAQLQQGRVWTLLTGPFILPDAPVAVCYGALAALYGTRVVTYVGPWYALKLAAAGTAASSAVFLTAASLMKWSPFRPPTPAHVSSGMPPPQRRQFVPSTEEGTTIAQRALNILKFGTHEAPGADAPRVIAPVSFADALFQFPHVGPAGGVSALAAFSVAAKRSAHWELWGGVKVPVALPAIIAGATAGGAAFAASPPERVSDAAHLLGGGAAGAAWLWALRRGHVRYRRFWPKR